MIFDMHKMITKFIKIAIHYQFVLKIKMNYADIYIIPHIKFKLDLFYITEIKNTFNAIAYIIIPNRVIYKLKMSQSFI